MPTQLVNPNLHVVMVHFPIAVLVVGAAIEVLSFVWRGSGFRAAGRWMILIGALASIPAATTGMYAARQAMGSPESTLAEIKHQAPFDADQWAQMRHHILYNGAAAAILSVLVIAWLGASDRIRQSAHFGYLLVLLVACGLISIGAWHGGELVFAHGTGMHLVNGGWPPPTKTEAASSSAGEDDHVPVDKSRAVFTALNAGEGQLHKVDDSTDIHVQLAGWTVALAVVTLGLSIRGLWLNPNRQMEDNGASDDDIVNALSGRNEKRGTTGLPAIDPDLKATALPARVPAARFWLLVFLLGLLTAVVGVMLLGPGTMSELTKEIKDYPRYMAHTVAGVSIVGLTLILALVTRFGPYNRVLIGGFSLLLALALAAQLWVGVLLLFDTNEGAIQHFNPPTTQSSMT